MNATPYRPLKLLAGLNTLFLVSIVLSLLGASGAQAQEALACTGKNFVEELGNTKPDLLAKAEAEAAATPNGQGRLWKIEKAGIEPSWLMGTMHVADPRILDLPESVLQAFNGAGTVVIETTDILDPRKMAGATASRPELTMFTDGSTLFSHLSEADATVLRTVLQQRGIPPYSVQKMKPWVLNSLFSLPKCQVAMIAGDAPLDIMLAKKAQAEGKKIDGLETAAEQIEAIAALPFDLHMRGLVELATIGSLVDDMNETMLELYLQGRIALIMPVMKVAVPERESSLEDYAAFEQKIITMRNHTMADRATPFLEDGNAFIAVGALHLPGQEGVVELLREKGYTLTSVE
ncbi:TraB/GumN family protein [Oryzicola mucosus]|uniref:TraB/GumN family protein n=1 Tax=Oryzicola mucosus TaxID=2767425 RepID=A0A8J6U4D5_9HYPH|nr:TraB/GumN family protein [Oryzicola mucosus]MBD0414100.1 TraB/GumN family protein [Oryzicola mucosus]